MRNELHTEEISWAMQQIYFLLNSHNPKLTIGLSAITKKSSVITIELLNSDGDAVISPCTRINIVYVSGIKNAKKKADTPNLFRIRSLNA